MDGSLEVRLYLANPGPQDTGQYACTIPGLQVKAALLTLYITQGTDMVYSKLLATSIKLHAFCKPVIFTLCEYGHNTAFNNRDKTGKFGQFTVYQLDDNRHGI